jgi:hypothetical protein
MPSFTPEVSAKNIDACETTTTTPVAAIFEATTADKLLFTRVQSLVALAIVLPSKSFTTVAADKWTLVSVGAKMAAEVVCTCESLRAEAALERSRMILRAF